MDRAACKIAFVSPHCVVDFTNGAATATLDALKLLASIGFACEAFCGTRMDEPHEGLVQESLFRRGIKYVVKKAKIPVPGGEKGAGSKEHDASRSRRAGMMSTPADGTGTVPATLAEREGTYDARLIFFLEGKVPVTLFENGSTRGGWFGAEEVKAFLKGCEIFLRRNRPDVVWTYGGDEVSIAVQRIARHFGIPILFALHNFSYRDAKPFRLVDRVVVPTKIARRYYREKLGLECEVLPLVVDADRVSVCSPGFSRNLGNTPPEGGTTNFVTFVNPMPLKGVFVFARIADVLARRRPDIRLLMVEGAARASHLPQLGISLTGLTNVTVWPNTPDARKFYAVSKLILMPSLMENAGFIAMEAMTNGIPVLASNRGGLPETIGGSPHPNPLPEGEGTNGCLSAEREEYVGGFLFNIPARYTPETRTVPTAEEGSPWVETIIRLWDDAEYYEQCSRTARERAQAWHPDHLGPVYRDFFSRVTRRPVVGRGTSCRP